MSSAPRIQVRHLGNSSLAGQEQVLDVGKQIRFGRRRENQVVYDADRDLLVSGQHAEIWVEGGVVRLADLGSTNGTFLNGQRISGPVALVPTDRVMFGENGPEFHVELLIPLVKDPPDQVAAIKGPPEKSVPSAEPSPIGDGIESVPDASDRKAEVELKASPGSPNASRAGEALSAKDGGKGNSQRGLGMKTVMGIVQIATQRERRRTLLVVGTIAAVLAVVAVVVWPKGPQSGSGSVDSSEIISAIEPSIYVVIVRTERDEKLTEVAGATAWSAEKGWLATNAHVAEMFQGLGAGESLLARSNSDPPIDLKIDSVRIHPGYGSFARLYERYRPYDPNSSGFLNAPQPNDVALLHVADADQGKQATPLRLADDTSLRRIRNGQPLIYVGFPKEGLNERSNVQRPKAHTVPCTLSKASDIFMARARRFEEEQHLTYNFQTAGGASGGPVVNLQGEVIGLLAAGNVVGVSETGARLTSGGTTNGPRSDLIRELLGDRAEAVQKARNLDWEERFSELFVRGATGAKSIFDHIGSKEFSAAAERAKLRLEGSPGIAAEQKLRIEKSGDENSVVFEFKVPADGFYLISAVAQDSPLRLGFLVSRNGVQAQRIEARDYWPICAFTARRDERVNVGVYADTSETKPTSGVQVRVFSAQF